MNTTLNYLEVIAWLERKGIEHYGNHFKILETDHQIIYKLIRILLSIATLKEKSIKNIF